MQFLNKLTIHEINPHRYFHLDEVAAKVVIELFGGDIICIVPGDKVVPKDEEKGELECAMEGRLLLGQGGGRLDDKRRNGSRIQGESCTTRAATFVGVRDMPELERLFRAVLRVDSSATASSTDLSHLIKCVLDANPEDVHDQIFQWAEQGVKAIIEYLMLPERPLCTDFVQPSILFEGLVEQGSISDDKRVLTEMRRWMSISESQVENCLELAFIARAMKVVGATDDEVSWWLSTGITHYAQQQIKYWQAVDEVQRSVEVFTLDMSWSRRELYGVFIRSDNSQIAKATRDPELRYAVCAVRTSSEHAAIMPNKSHVKMVDMRAMWALVRIHEIEPALRVDAYWDDYCQPGNHVNVPQWHMMADGGAALNSARYGSLPTSLNDETLVKIIQVALGSDPKRYFYNMVHEARRMRQSRGGYRQTTEHREDGNVEHSGSTRLSKEDREKLGQELDKR